MFFSNLLNYARVKKLDYVGSLLIEDGEDAGAPHVNQFLWYLDPISMLCSLKIHIFYIQKSRIKEGTLFYQYYIQFNFCPIGAQIEHHSTTRIFVR